MNNETYTHISALEMTGNDVGSGASSAAALVLVDDSGHSYSVANLMAFATNGHADDTKAINFAARMPYAGTYRLRLDYSLYANGSGATSSVSVSAGGTIVKNFVKAKNESQLGRGLAVVFDGNNYLYYGNRTENSSSKELIYKGAIDIPGVLLWAGGRSSGGTSFYEGAKKHNLDDISREGVGAYKIYHSIGHTSYAIEVGVESTSPSVWYYKNKTTTYIEIVICNMSSTPIDKNFTVTLTGKN